MQSTRRAVVRGSAAAAALLGGCGASLRENSAPGGLELRNRRASSVTVSIRARKRPPSPTEPLDPNATEVPSPTATPETPFAVENPDASGEFEVGAGGERRVADFFPEPGAWSVEALVGGASGRSRIQLHAAIPGPAGVDTVVVTAEPGGRVTARATQVD